MALPKGSPKPAGSGRAPGTPNKTTLEARRAIADFVDGNAHRLQEWLDGVARGVPLIDPDTGKQRVNAAGHLQWHVPPNPEKAFLLFQSVVEYHVPKLARSEVTGPNGGPLQTLNQSVDLRGLKGEDLEQMEKLLQKAAVATQEAVKNAKS